MTSILNLDMKISQLIYILYFIVYFLVLLR